MSEKPKRKRLTEEEKAARKAQRIADAKKLAERREREMILYVGGASFRQIADQISIGGGEIKKSTVEKDINLMLDQEMVDGEAFIMRMRALNIRRLNTLILANMGPAQKGDLKKGELVRKLIGDISDLSGAKMPLKMEHDHNFNPKELSDEELQRIANSSGKS